LDYRETLDLQNVMLCNRKLTIPDREPIYSTLQKTEVLPEKRLHYNFIGVQLTNKIYIKNFSVFAGPFLDLAVGENNSGLDLGFREVLVMIFLKIWGLK
jgi:hypothetical protein